MGNYYSDYRITKELFSLGKDIILSEKFQQLKSYTQHGTTSVFEHSVSVAKYSLVMALSLEMRLGVKLDKKSIVRGALLHDYFLYDWHTDRSHGLHGFTHPGTALNNAERDFELNDTERDIIKKHMFPLIPVPPMTRESAVVCLADKWCATCETFKIDISSYTVYRLNLRYDISHGLIRIGGRDTAESVSEG
ncbi:MAG: HD domain-containing protein [Clostridiales bacterium]|nr:HD domain-containing protein [Clostridiales bacterium]